MSPDEVANRIRLALVKGRHSLKELHTVINVDARYILRTLLRLQGVGQVDAYPDPVSNCMWYVLRGMANEERAEEATPEPAVVDSLEPVAPTVEIDIAIKPAPKRGGVRPFIRMTAGVWICYSRGCAEAGDTPRAAYDNWAAKAERLAA